jgi:DNA-binding NarL/FixJ family response regulator
MAPDAPFKALIADDHSLYRTGLSFLLKDRLGIADVIEVSGFDDALDKLAAQSDIRLALFDLSMPGMGGPDSLRVVKETYPQVRVAVVSGSEDRDLVLKAVTIGLSGYVPKSLPEDEFVSALQHILAGHMFIPRFMTASLPVVRALSPGPAPETSAAAVVPVPATASLEGLTPRQRDVLKCVLRGLSNKEIGRDLDIAEGTVKIHLAALFAQFQARNRTELATRAQSLGH